MEEQVKKKKKGNTGKGKDLYYITPPPTKLLDKHTKLES